jgi:SAM-dependent methyltransferase
VCPPRADYVGVDFDAGKDVDVILEDPYKLPFSDEAFNAVVCTSCFEHCEMFWLLHLEIMRVLEPAGLFYLNVPSNGICHRFPVDCWRFYPDSGIALVNWGRRHGLKCAVLESYVGNTFLYGDGTDPINDFVCVFIKDDAYAYRYPNRILDTGHGFSNGYVRGRNSLLKRIE